MANASGQSRIHREITRGPAGGATMTFASGARLAFEAGSSMTLRGNMDWDLTSGVITFPGSLGRGYIPLDLTDAREAVATGRTGLTTGTNPELRAADQGNGHVRVRWTTAAGATDPLYFPPVRVPDDLATAGGLRVHIVGEGASANATNELSLRFFSGTATASGGFTTRALTSSPVEQNATIASGSVPATGFFTLGLSPNAHASGAVDLFNVGLSYQRRTS